MAKQEGAIACLMPWGVHEAPSDSRGAFPRTAYDLGLSAKATRMWAQSHRPDGGQVFLPKNAPVPHDFLSEVRRFS